MRRRLGLALLACALPACALAQQQDPTVSEVVVVAPTPLAGGIATSRFGSTVQRVGADDFARTGSPSVTEALQRNVPGINVSDTQGNMFTGDVNYRGFVASPLQGLPQGLAVYLNGQRLNEAFGDTMNWDMIPAAGIASADLTTNNPAFGLNALGGSINLRMKDGFSYSGIEAEAQGGEFGSMSAWLQGGWSNEAASLYAVIDGGSEDGWRQQSSSEVLRGYLDFGLRLGDGELHFVGASSHSDLGVVGPSPVDLLEEDRTAVYTYPQTTANTASLFAINGATPLGEAWTLQGSVGYRRFDQDHVDGNDAEFERCSSATTGPTAPFRNTLCLEDDFIPAPQRPGKGEFQVLTLAGAPIPCPMLLSNPASGNGCAVVPYGSVDRTRTRTKTTNASAQAVNDGELFGRKNTLTLGASIAESDIRFSANSTLGLITPDLKVVDAPASFSLVGPIAGLGEIIQAGTGEVGYGPAEVTSNVRHAGVFFSDTLDLTPALSVTLGGRYNQAEVELRDLTGRAPNLNTNSSFSRFNPALTFAWRAADGLTLFGGYSETNRAPTPLELGCSDPLRPCLLENSLVSDPPLRQVVSKTFEGGLRFSGEGMGGTVRASAAVFSTRNDDDIVSLASTLVGRGYYANVPRTNRSGFEGDIEFTQGNWTIAAGYAYVDAEYGFSGLFASPNNPEADDNGDIEIENGDKIGGIPAHRFKVGGSFRPIEALTLSADAQYAGSQYFVGDEGNDNEKLRSYWTANLRADYAVTEKISLFGRVTNLFDEDYATYGVFFEGDGAAKIIPNPLPADPEETSVTPAQPRTFHVGVRARF